MRLRIHPERPAPRKLAPAIDAGVHRGANWLQNKAVHGVDHAIDSSAGGGYWAS